MSQLICIFFVFLVAVSPGQVKLTGGSSPHEGLVQVRLYNRWGTICNDNFGVREASIICQMLGHSKYAFLKLFHIHSRT